VKRDADGSPRTRTSFLDGPSGPGASARRETAGLPGTFVRRRRSGPVVARALTASLLGLGVALGCADGDQPPEAEEAREAPAPSSADAEIPVPADFEAEARAEIDEENYEAVLEDLEAELSE
jgi:hypothetical protein